MSAAAQAILRRLPLRMLLAGATAAMAVCARTPAAGAGWRTGFVVAALASYAFVWLAWKRGGYTRRGVLGLAVVLRLLVLPLPPALSDDGFRYVWDGLVQVEAGVNPYRYAPADPALAAWHDEAVYAHLNSRERYAVYPPVSQAVFAVGALLYPYGWEASWYLIKLLIVAAELAGLWLLSRLTCPTALVLYAWNPLVVVEAAGQAHTDALVVPLLLVTVWALRERRGGLAGAAIAAAGWVKLLPFVLLPFVARRVGVRAIVMAAMAGGLLAAPYAAGYVLPHVRGSLALYVALFEFNAGPYYALKGVFLLFTGDDWSKQLGPALAALYLVALLALYAVDRRSGGRPLVLPFLLSLGLFFACATTVHPWYLLPLLALVPLAAEGQARHFARAWLWLGTLSLATYWRYAGPSWGYTTAVAVGWIGWGGWTAAGLLDLGLPVLMRVRAERKWRWILSLLPVAPASKRVLDLGAGEGYVGAAAQREGAEVVLADVVDFNRTALPLVVYDGRTLPLEDGQFDLTLLVFVLHHAQDPERVLAEAKRVTRGGIVVVESVAERPRQRRMLERADRLANRLRSGGSMRDQEAALRFRSDQEWRALFERLELQVVAAKRRGRVIHRRWMYRLEPLLQ